MTTQWKILDIVKIYDSTLWAYHTLGDGDGMDVLSEGAA